MPVTINANFVKQSVGVLASATPVKYFNNFAGAPDADLWYPSAMANALAGKDLDPNNPEITIQINSSVGPELYLGTDGNCPANQYDLESIIVHEMAHYSVGPLGGQLRAGTVAAWTNLRTSVISGGLLCIGMIGISASFFPEFRKYDVRTNKFAAEVRNLAEKSKKSES